MLHPTGDASSIRVHRPRLIAVCLAVCLCCVFDALLGVRLITTRVYCAGESQTVVSLSDDPQTIIEKTSFDLGQYDKLLLDTFDADKDGGEILIEKHSDYSAGSGMSTLALSDAVSDVIENIEARVAMEAKVKAFKIRIICDGKKKTYTSRGGSVEEALTSAGITLGDDDLVSVPLDAPVKAKMTIRVQRVAYRETTKVREVAYSTKEKKSDQLYIGETAVERAGVPGEETFYYLQKLVDGEVQDTLELGSSVTKAPVQEMILTGTKARIIKKGSVGESGVTGRTAISELPATLDIKVDVNGKPVEYKQKIVGQATAYSGGGITSTGRSAMPGRVAVDPREIPYGSKLFIVSSDGRYIYGYCEAADTGGFIYNSRTVVDLYMHSESACVQFGRRNVEIYVLE